MLRIPQHWIRQAESQEEEYKQLQSVLRFMQTEQLRIPLLLKENIKGEGRGRWYLWKIIEGRDQDLLVKMVVVHIGGGGGGLLKVEGESTDFYEKYMDFVAAMLFAQQIFHLEWLFLFWYFLIYIYLIFYYFGWSLSLVLLTKVFFFKKKHVTLFFSVLKMKKWLCHISLFFCLSSISLGWYC